MSRKLNTLQINVHLLFVIIYVTIGLCILNEIYFHNEKILDYIRLICIVILLLCMLYIRSQKNVIENMKESTTVQTIQLMSNISSLPPSIEPYEENKIDSTTNTIVFQNKTSLRRAMIILCLINVFILGLFILSTLVTILTKKKFSFLIFQDIIPNLCCRQFQIKILSFSPLCGLLLAVVCFSINYREVSNYLSFSLLLFPIVFTILCNVSKPLYDKIFTRTCPKDGTVENMSVSVQEFQTIHMGGQMSSSIGGFQQGNREGMVEVSSSRRNNRRRKRKRNGTVSVSAPPIYI